MYELLSGPEASALDKSLVSKYSLSEEHLIKNAASFVFAAHKELFKDKTILFVVGKGNNGSDALYLAFLSLSCAKKVYIYMHFPLSNGENERFKERLDKSLFVQSLVDCDVIVDGLFGVKMRPGCDERTQKVVDFINSSNAYVISLDVPSLYKVRANCTISFMALKREMYLPQNRATCGNIELYNPGFPDYEIKGSGKYFLVTFSDYKSRKFNLSDYKNTRGDLTIVGGCSKYPGAPILSSLAAFHSGCGKVRVLSTEKTNEAILSSYPSIILSQSLKESSSFVVGPGWGRGSKKKLEEIVLSEKNFVLDADALKLLPSLKMKFSYRAIITPHLGETKMLLRELNINLEDYYEAIKELCKRLEVIVVSKSSTVTISDGDNVYIVDGANPSLGVAGSGDVLSGIIGAFLAQGMSPLSSALNGTLLHQESGKRAHEKWGFYSAENLIEMVGKTR